MNIYYCIYFELWGVPLLVGLSSIFASMQDFFFLVGYVSNYNLFPEPLTPEEERKYLELYENGDEDYAENIRKNLMWLEEDKEYNYETKMKNSGEMQSVGGINL